jgi:hypothetical protein
MPKNRFMRIAEESRRKTNDELADELARVTPLTQEKLNKLLPTRQDKENLAKLMAIVTSSASQNQKVADLRKNMTKLGGVVVKVLGALI